MPTSPQIHSTSEEVMLQEDAFQLNQDLVQSASASLMSLVDLDLLSPLSNEGAPGTSLDLDWAAQ